MELLRIKGWETREGTECRLQPPLPGSALSAITMEIALPWACEAAETHPNWIQDPQPCS